ncbi:hypothetical protein Ancab_018149 [Ancistrocladus abbreviatus]
MSPSLSCSPFSSSSSPAHSLSNTSDSDPLIVSSVVSILVHLRSKSRWSTLLSHYRQGFTPDQVSQIIRQIRNNPLLALRFFQFTIQHSLSSHTLRSYSTMIHILSRARLKPRAQSLIKTALRVSDSENGDLPGDLRVKVPDIFETLVKTYRLCDSAPFVFDLLINACLESNRIDQSVKIVRMLQSRGIHPKVRTCNLLIIRVSRNRGCHFAYDLYKEIFGIDDQASIGAGLHSKILPNVYTFNGLMHSFYQNELVDKVEEVWVEMVKLNCEPNVSSYNILMAAYCDRGDIGKALNLWEEMRLKGLKQDIVAYNTLIGGYCQTGEIEKGEELYREMGLCGIESTCLSYEHLINGYCKIGDVDSAMLLYRDMCRKGFTPNSSTIDSLVRELCSKKVSEALDFFRMVMKNVDFVARRSSYTYLIKGLCEEGKMKEALKLQAEMVGKGFKPGSEIYDAFIDGYMKQGKLDVAKILWKEMLQAQAQPGDS